MKLSKSLLIKLIDDIEENITVKQADHDIAFMAHCAAERHKWIKNELPKFKALRDLLTKKLRLGVPITQDEVKALGFRNRWNSLDFEFYHEPFRTTSFMVGGKTYNGYPQADGQLKQLRSALEVILDEEVSTSALANMGFRNMEWFWRKAAEAQAQ